MADPNAAISPEEITLLSVLSFAMLQNARADKAAIVLEAMDLLDPGRIPTLRALAVSQLRCAKPDKALRTLDKLALAGGADTTFHLLRAQALSGLQRPAEAAAAMQTFLEMREAATKATQEQTAARRARVAAAQKATATATATAAAAQRHAPQEA